MRLITFHLLVATFLWYPPSSRRIGWWSPPWFQAQALALAFGSGNGHCIAPYAQGLFSHPSSSPPSDTTTSTLHSSSSGILSSFKSALVYLPLLQQHLSCPDPALDLASASSSLRPRTTVHPASYPKPLISGSLAVRHRI